MQTFDVIVVGGGISGGIPAATYLQKAGLNVVIVEGRPELGNFCPTHETWPGTLDSPHASINFSGNSPAIQDLELESRYGYQIRTSPVVPGTAHPDGTNCLICYDPEQTAESVARHSEAAYAIARAPGSYRELLDRDALAGAAVGLVTNAL